MICGVTPLPDPLLSRREAIAALASTAALPLMSACGRDRAPTAARARQRTRPTRCALLDEVGRQSPSPVAGERDLARHRHRRESGASIPARPIDRPRGSSGSRRSFAPTWSASTPSTRAASRTPRAPASRSCAAPMRRRSKGFALPYGDITVGGWRNTPYVVIQNVGAYLDIPRFLDSDHRIENAADAEAYLARLQSYAKQLDGELGRMQAARAAGLVPPAFLIDKALAQMRLSAKNAREGGTLVESIERRTKNIRRQLGRARADDRARRRSRPRSSGSCANCRHSAPIATNDAGISARPRGEEFYRWALKASTTTTMSPDEVHEMGQSELQAPACADGRDPEGGRLHAGHRRRTDEGAGEGSPLQVLRRRQGPRRDPGVHPESPRLDPGADAARVQHGGQSEHGGEAAAARRRARRARRVRRRGIDRRQDPRPVLDQPQNHGPPQQVQPRRPDLPRSDPRPHLAG